MEYTQKQEQLRKKKQSLEIQRNAQNSGLSALALGAIQRQDAPAPKLRPADVVALQRTVGNHAVAKLLNRNAHADAPPTQNGPVVQTNRIVGSANDQDKQGADVAHELSHTVQQGAAPIQRQPSQRVSHNLTHGGQPMQGVVQRDEIMPLEDYGNLSIPKWWQLSKRLKSKRKATPSNRMKPQEDREEVGRRLQGRKDEAREKAKKAGKPAPDELTQKTDDLGEMYAHAQMLKDFYDHTLENLAYDTGGTYNAGPIKTLGRAMDKVSTDYTDKEGVERPERVKDLLRSAIVYKNAADLAHGARRIRLLEPNIKVRNLKNKFDGTGYGDINMSLEVGDQFITELQLHLSSFWEMKKQKSDHDRYEHISQLKRAKEKKGSLKPKDQSQLERLTQEHNRSYIDALNSEDDPQQAIEILKAIR